MCLHLNVSKLCVWGMLNLCVFQKKNITFVLYPCQSAYVDLGLKPVKLSCIKPFLD